MKPRQKWFKRQTERANFGFCNVTDERNQAIKRIQASKDLCWDFIGPKNIAGRSTAMIVDEMNPDCIFLGTAGGGIWKSIDVGRSWSYSWDPEFTQIIGALAAEPGNPKVLYCGTGEANMVADSYPGDGLYISKNSGVTWEILASTKKWGIPTRISAIAINPNDSRHILVGGLPFDYSSDQRESLGGIYESIDSGNTWQRMEFATRGTYACHDILFHPKEKNCAFATLSGIGSQETIWKYEKGKWKALTNGFPFPTNFGRGSFALNDFKGKICIYLLVTEADNPKAVHTFKSQNNGSSWKRTLISNNYFDYIRLGNAYEDQMNYNNTIVVDPMDPDFLICGGVDLHLSRDGGETWQLVTRWDDDKSLGSYVHADHHALEIRRIPTGDGGFIRRIYDANDGGFAISEDDGVIWEDRSMGLETTMFYDVDVAPKNGAYLVGGTQDNGTLISADGQSGIFAELMGGDGGWSVFDPKNYLTVFSTTQGFRLYRSTLKRGASTRSGQLDKSDFKKGKHQVEITPPIEDFEITPDTWMVFLVIRPDKPRSLITGSIRPWISKNGGNNWNSLEILDGKEITAIEISRNDPGVFFVGTMNGDIFRFGKNSLVKISGSNLPCSPITRIVSQSDDIKKMVITFGRWGHSHAFRTVNGGVSWVDIDHDPNFIGNGRQRRLPDVPHRGLAQPAGTQAIYLATDAGIFFSPDFGNNWENFNGNLPNVAVRDIVYHESDKTLTIATYGRGLWQLTRSFP